MGSNFKKNINKRPNLAQQNFLKINDYDKPTKRSERKKKAIVYFKDFFGLLVVF